MAGNYRSFDIDAFCQNLVNEEKGWGARSRHSRRDIERGTADNPQECFPTTVLRDACDSPAGP